MRALRWALALGVLAVLARAAEDGGQSLAFSKLPVGARSAALGQACGAVGGDAYGMVANPALLATLDDLRIGSQWASLPTGRNQQFLGLGRPIDKGTEPAIGLSFDRSALDKVIEGRRANTPDPDSVFSEEASIIGVGIGGWALPKELACGAAVKVLSQSIGEANSGGFSCDLGFLYQARPWLAFGLDFQDAASIVTWNTGASETLPMVVRGSVASSLWQDRWLLSTDIEKSQAQAPKVHVGSEVWAWQRYLALRVGWNDGQWATGFGARVPLKRLGVEAGLDYALAGDPLGFGDLQQRISLDVGVSLD